MRIKLCNILVSSYPSFENGRVYLLVLFGFDYCNHYGISNAIVKIFQREEISIISCSLFHTHNCTRLLLFGQLVQGMVALFAYTIARKHVGLYKKLRLEPYSAFN